MPADNSLSDAPTAHHGDASKPYPCHAAKNPPGADWGIDYGYCRNSLDALEGSRDPRCPADCPHKAPQAVVAHFDKLFQWHGAARAAAYARDKRRGQR